jgi:hypothetical protein
VAAGTAVSIHEFGFSLYLVIESLMELNPLVVGEFVGTAVLILLGNGVVAGVLLNRSKAQDAGWLAISAGWALAVFSGVAVSTSIGDKDAHLNPAFTVASRWYGSFICRIGSTRATPRKSWLAFPRVRQFGVTEAIS